MAQKQQVRFSLSPKAYALVEAACADRDCHMSDVIEAAIVAYLDPEASDEKLDILRTQLMGVVAGIEELLIRTAPQDSGNTAEPFPDAAKAFYQQHGTWDLDLRHEASFVQTSPFPKRRLLTRIFRQGA